MGTAFEGSDDQDLPVHGEFHLFLVVRDWGVDFF